MVALSKCFIRKARLTNSRCPLIWHTTASVRWWLQISGWESTVKINLRVEKQGVFVRIFADNGSVSFGIEADFLSVQKISGYAAGNERKTAGDM